MSETGYQFVPAPTGLDAVVEGIWRLRQPAGSAPERIAPDGRCEILLHRAGPPIEHRSGSRTRQPEAFLYGPLGSALTLEQDGPMDVIGIRLQPWAPGGLGETPSLWRDQALSLDGVIGRPAARNLQQAAHTHPDPAAFLAAMADDIISLFRPLAAARTVQSVWPVLAAEGCGLDVLAERTGLSARTVSRHFERACGLTAGEMIRICRFQLARAAIKRGEDSLADIAAQAGYSDQAHMTREFRRFAGETPHPVRQPASFDVFYPDGASGAEG